MKEMKLNIKRAIISLLAIVFIGLFMKDWIISVFTPYKLTSFGIMTNIIFAFIGFGCLDYLHEYLERK